MLPGAAVCGEGDVTERDGLVQVVDVVVVVVIAAVIVVAPSIHGPTFLIRQEHSLVMVHLAVTVGDKTPTIYSTTLPGRADANAKAVKESVTDLIAAAGAVRRDNRRDIRRDVRRDETYPHLT